MSSTPIKIYKSEQLRILNGEIVENPFVRTTNIRLRFPLYFGNLKPEAYSFKGLNVLWVAYDVNDTSKKYIISKLQNAGANISSPMSQSDFGNANAKSLASTYDIVVVDLHVWAVWAGSMSKAKECADEGLVVVTSGNDTNTNTFFTGVSIPNESTHLGITSDNVSHITKTQPGESVGSVGTDVNIYATNLQHGAKQLYYHSDIGTYATMGFIYESTNGLGGSLIHDQSGSIIYYYFETRGKYFIFYQLSKYIQAKNNPIVVKYIRDQTSGNSINDGNHWVEIQAYKKHEWGPWTYADNLCYQLNATSNKSLTNSSAVTDGIYTNTTSYTGAGSDDNTYIQLELTNFNNVNNIKIWHYYGDTRYYNSNITSISKDGTLWYQVFNSDLQGTYYENIQGHAINLLNFNGNNSTIETGLSIEDSFTNLVNTDNGALGPWPYAYGWGSATDIQYGYINNESTPNNTSYVMWVSWNTTDGSGLGMRLAATDTVYNISASTVYTVSIFKKNVKGIVNPISSINNIYLREYDNSNNQLAEHGKALYYETLNNGWYRIWGIFTTQSTTDHIAIQMYDYTSAECEVRLYGAQLIKQTCCSGVREFTKNIKLKSLAELYIPGGFKYGTIIGKFMPRTAFTNNNTYTDTANQSALLRFQDDTNSGGAYYRYYVNGSGNSYPFFDPDGYWKPSDSLGHIHQEYTLESNKEVTWVVQKNTTNFILKIYQNNTLKGTHTAVLNSSAEINRLVFGNDVIWNGTHYDITFFDDILTINDLEKSIFKTKGSIKSTGNFILNNVNELGENLWPLIELSESTSYSVNGHGVAVYYNDDFGEYHQMSYTETDGTYKGFDVPAEDGKTYVFSGWFWQSSGNTFNYYPCVIEHETSGTEIRSASFTNSPVEEWFYGWSIGTANSTYNNLRCLIYPNSVGTTGSGTVKWRNISFREATPSEIRMLNNGTFQCGDLSEL